MKKRISVFFVVIVLFVLLINCEKKETPLTKEIPPELTYRKVPEYPESAKIMGIEGKVYLQVYVNQTGEVEGVEVYRSSDSYLLDKCAKRAATQCKFKPATIAGLPVKGKFKLKYTFVLNSGKLK